MVWPVKKTKRLARSVSNAFIEGISLSVAFHGAKAAAWVDMVIGIVVDHDTYRGVFTAVATNKGSSLIPFLPMRYTIAGLMTSFTSSSTPADAGPAMIDYGTSPAMGAGMFSFLSYARYRLHMP